MQVSYIDLYNSALTGSLLQSWNQLEQEIANFVHETGMRALCFLV